MVLLCLEKNLEKMLGLAFCIQTVQPPDRKQQTAAVVSKNSWQMPVLWKVFLTNVTQPVGIKSILSQRSVKSAVCLSPYLLGLPMRNHSLIKHLFC